MNQLQQTKTVLVTAPAARVDAGSFTTTTIDTIGFNKLSVYFAIGDIDAAMTALRLDESNDSGMANAVKIAGAEYGVSNNPDTGAASALPTSSDDNKVYAWHVDLKGRRRYIDVVATSGDGAAGTFASCIAVLYNGNETQDNAAERGLAANLIVPSL